LGEFIRLGTVRLILPKAAWRLDGADLVEVEIEYSLQCLASSGVTERVGERLEPLRVFVLQGDEFGHGIAPTLMAAAAVGGSAVADDRGASVPRAVASLAFGPGKRLIALWSTPPGMAHNSVT
jgi:hypothetical protein